MRKREVFSAKSEAAKIVSEILNRHPEYSQSEIAEGAGFSGNSCTSIMTQVKSGRTNLPIDRACAMCKFLKEDPSKLLVAILKENHAATLVALIEANFIAANEAERETLKKLRGGNVRARSVKIA